MTFKINRNHSCKFSRFYKPRPKPDCDYKPKWQKVKFSCHPKLEPKPVASYEYGYLTGDPHLRGADGELYDIKGIPGSTYSVVKDKGLNYKAQFDYVDQWGNTGVTKSNIVVRGKGKKTIVFFDKDGTAKLKTLSRGNKEVVTIEPGKEYNLADGGTVSFGPAVGGGPDGQKLETRLIVKTREYTITQVARDGKYIDSNVETGERGVYSDRVMPKGLLGDTFDRGDEKRVAQNDMGKGVLNGPINRYRARLNFMS